MEGHSGQKEKKENYRGQGGQMKLKEETKQLKNEHNNSKGICRHL